MSLKVFIILFLSLLVSIQLAKSENCEEKQAQAEKLLRIVLRADNTISKAITTEKDFSDYCKRAKQGLILFKAYSDCLSGIGKQIYSILKTTTSKALKNHCVLNPDVSLKYLSCFEDRNLSHNYRKCLIQFNGNLDYTAEKAEENEIFPSLCCGFKSLSRCLDETFKSNGACTDPKIDLRTYSKTLFRSLFGNVFDTFCSGYNQQICTEKLAEMNKHTSGNKFSLANFSIVKNLIKLSEKLSS